MGIHSSDLRQYVIRPALHYLNLWSEAAEDLLLGTAAVETGMGYRLKQVKGPALGIYQMEPATHLDLWLHWLVPSPRRRGLREALLGLVSFHVREKLRLEGYSVLHEEMVVSLAYATAMARCFYLRVPWPLPKAGDIQAQACYWKHWWNSERGKGTVDGYVRAYQRLVRDA